MRSDAIGRAGLYLGGFLGPFGGGVVTVLVPNLAGQLHVSTTVVALAIPAYLVPFAALQLVSGTIGERLGIVGTVRVAFVAYAVASAAVAAVSSIAPFLLARAAQGAANAFTSPLILAVLAESATDETLGRTMGTFASVQTAGMVSAPLCGGLLGAIDPGLAFLVPGLLALGLAFVPLPTPKRRTARPPRLRTAFNRRVGWLALAAALAFFAILGVALPVSLRATDVFDIGTTTRGVLLAAVRPRRRDRRSRGGQPRRPDRQQPRGGRGRARLRLRPAAAGAGRQRGARGGGVVRRPAWGRPSCGPGSTRWPSAARPRTVPGRSRSSGRSSSPARRSRRVIWVPIYDARGWVAFAGAGFVALAIVPALVRARWTEAPPVTGRAGDRRGHVTGTSQTKIDAVRSRLGNLTRVAARAPRCLGGVASHPDGLALRGSKTASGKNLERAGGGCKSGSEHDPANTGIIALAGRNAEWPRASR